MVPIVKVTSPRQTFRRYDNSSRSERALATRRRIVDAAVKVLARGPDELSMPAVAEAAGVSVPTVYRNFPSKKALVDSVFERYTSTIDSGWPSGAPGLDEFLARVPQVFERHDRVPRSLRAAMTGPTGRRARRDDMPARRTQVEAMVSAAEPKSAGFDNEDRERLVDVLIVLASSATRQAFEDYLGADATTAADRVTWAIRRLVNAK
jgi:AcrR family transcriptional regulator